MAVGSIVFGPKLDQTANQWPADDFWHSVRCAVRLVEGELTMIKPDADEIEQMILRSWLDFSAPAGNA